MHFLSLLVYLFLCIVGIGSKKPEDYQRYSLLQAKLKEMQESVFDQVILTSIAEDVLDSMPQKEVESHHQRDSRSKRVLRSIQDQGCKDALDSKSCRYLRFNGECEAKKTDMMLYCPETCGFCAKKPQPCMISRHGCCLDGITPAYGPGYEGCPEKCNNKKSTRFCKVVKRLSMCFDNSTSASCQKTCGYCRPCEDDNKLQCYYAAKYGSCGKLTATMMNECRRSCKFCGKKDLCHSHPCPRYSMCFVNNYKAPVCRCSKKCHKGDFHTGPICARNGWTYKNLCDLKRTVCHKSHHVTVKRYGKCNDGLRALTEARCKRPLLPEPNDCKLWKLNGFCEKKKKQMIKLCPHTCNYCVNRYPQPACHYTKYGCCLDNKTACKGVGYQGCPDKKRKCKDFSKILCRRFVALCGHRRHMEFLKPRCPKTCMFC